MSFHTSHWIRTKCLFFFLGFSSRIYWNSPHSVLPPVPLSPSLPSYISDLTVAYSATLRCIESLFCCCWSFDSSPPLCDAQINWRGATYFYQSIANVLFRLKQRCQFKLRIHDGLWSVYTPYRVDLPSLGYSIWGQIGRNNKNESMRKRSRVCLFTMQIGFRHKEVPFHLLFLFYLYFLLLLPFEFHLLVLD